MRSATLPVVVAPLIWMAAQPGFAAPIEVGPGKPFTRIEDAHAKAQPGDTILVHPQENGEPYQQTAVFVRRKNLTFRAVPTTPGQRVKISGRGFDYNGAGSVPRAIFQFSHGADGCVLEGFDLSGAHNDTHNGAGVRIVEANHVRIRNCSIHHNDMGIMSSGDGTENSALDQRIENCAIHHNGDFAEPGYNHNLYLGGTSVTLSACEVYNSLTGHNVKSRAHYTRVEYCYIHHSSNREFDLVDAGETARPGSDAVLIGNVIVKDPEGKGNGTVIHFGQDGGKNHNGTLHLVFNTILSPSIAPIVDLSSPGAGARLIGNVISDGGVRQARQKIAHVRGGARLEAFAGMDNWFSGGFEPQEGWGLDAKTNRFERADALFVDPARHDYRLRSESAKTATSSLSPKQIELPPLPGGLPADVEPPLTWQYKYPAGKEKRPSELRLTLGAYAR